MTKVYFFDPDYKPAQPLLYSIIVASFKGSWIFVRHNGKETWEIAGGHIEPDEDPFDTARRELTEETGASDFSLVCVATYSVETEAYLGFGRIYLATVASLGEIPDKAEIAEILLSEQIPADLTYPEIQPRLFRKCLEYIRTNGLP